MTLLESFRAARWIRLANLVVQAALFVSFFAGLNYLAGSHALRYDLTRARRYSLSPETQAYLRSLKAPVSIVVTSDEDRVSPELRGLLREYEYATETGGAGRITVEYLDVYLRHREAERMGVDTSDIIRLRCGEKTETITFAELYGGGDGQRRTFLGEQAITSAVLDVSNPERKKVYFLVGHGELRPTAVDPTRGLSTAAEQLRERNLDVDSLDLTSQREIPADASLLIAAQPRNPYSPREQELLRVYLGTNAGRLLLFLAPGYPYGLERLLYDWAIRVDDDLVRDRGLANVTEDDDLIVRRFASHPITQELLGYGTLLRVGRARSLSPDPMLAASNGLDVVTLASTSPTAWGEINYRNRNAAAYSPKVDLRPRPEGLGLVVASEPAAVRDNLPFSVPRGRVVVFGTGDLIDNLRIANDGVIDIFLHAVDWAVDRDTRLNIRPRPIDRFQLSLSAGDKARLDYCLILALPGAAALLGLIVYWTRRA